MEPPEAELARALASTRRVRDREAARISALLARSSFGALLEVLADQRLVPLIGARALDAADDPPPGFRAAVERATAEAGERARVLEVLAAHIGETFAAREIRMLPLKGPFLARRLYGDITMRTTNDLDLLVERDRIADALAVLAELGLELDPERGRPADLHRVLRHPQGRLPRIEVHWRLHWYEEEFSAAMLRAAVPAGSWLAATPEDELAALLLFYARDGFYGLRGAADIAAWWDLFGDESREAPVLAGHVERFPDLKRALISAAAVAERTVGVPALRIVPPSAVPGTRERVASRLANWDQAGDLDQLSANVALVDMLLSPRRELPALVRRHLWLNHGEIAEIYSLRSSHGLAARAWRIVHVPEIALRVLLGLAGFRGRGSRQRSSATAAPRPT